MLCVNRRVLDAYDSARIAQYENYLQTKLGQKRELNVPPPRPVHLTTARCLVGGGARRPDRPTPQQSQETDVDTEDDDDWDDDY